MPSKTKDLAIVACLSSANVAFRFALAGGPPNIKPAAFLVIVAGIVGGPVVGFAVGWLSMTLSDISGPFGAGLWTIEASACMATIGLIAGLVWFKSQDLNRWELAVGGFLLTVLYEIGTAIIDRRFSHNSSDQHFGSVLNFFDVECAGEETAATLLPHQQPMFKWQKK